MRNSLPIKTKDGIIKELRVKTFQKKKKKNEFIRSNRTRHLHIPNNCCDSKTAINEAKTNPISIVKLLEYREQKLRLFRFQIGVLASDILEYPEEKICNIVILLNFMDERDPEIFVSVRKLAAATLLEIFRDLLPLYSIHYVKKNEMRMKKETLKLQNFESVLLKYYKEYLRKLEKMIIALRRKRHNLGKQNIYLGIFSIVCISSLLITRPYINFSSNIAKFLVPYLNHPTKNIRKLIEECFIQVFKNDKAGELSVIIIRRLNKFLKIKKYLVNIEVISVLRGLQLEYNNLQKEKEESNKHNTFHINKKEILPLHKKQLKRKIKFKKIQNEMRETKAKQNSLSKQKNFKEIFDAIIMIYLRLLRSSPGNFIIYKCLEGLTKFVDCGSIEFSQDLISFLDKLLQSNHFSLSEQLLCIHVAFIIISNQLTTMNIDCHRFYISLYKNLLDIHNGRNYKELDIVLQTSVQALLYKSISTTQICLLDFVKRILATTLALEQHSALAFILLIKLIIQNSRTSLLIDTDSPAEKIFYLSKEREFLHAPCISLWELTALQRHYHKTTESISIQLLLKVSYGEYIHLPKEIYKFSPRDIYINYNPLLGCFQPNIYIPKNLILKNIRNVNLTSIIKKFSKSIPSINLFLYRYCDIYSDYKEYFI